jgi:hypothetical protein
MVGRRTATNKNDLDIEPKMDYNYVSTGVGTEGATVMQTVIGGVSIK